MANRVRIAVITAVNQVAGEIAIKADDCFDQNIQQDLGFDSLYVMETFMLIEEELGIKITDYEVWTLLNATIQEIIEVIEPKMAKKQSATT